MNLFTIQKSFAISAGAGSGKTFTLSRRYINALLGFDFFRSEIESDKSFVETYVTKSSRVDEIVTITYTEAAALEMKERIFGLVEEIARFGESDFPSKNAKEIQSCFETLDHSMKSYVQDRMKQALCESATARISTIHSFCLGILRQFSDIARIDSAPVVIKDQDKSVIISKVTESVLNLPQNESTVRELAGSLGSWHLDGFITKYLSSRKLRENIESMVNNPVDIEWYKSILLDLYPLRDISGAIDELQGKNDQVRIDWIKNSYDAFSNFAANSFTEKSPSFGETKFPNSDGPAKFFKEDKNKARYTLDPVKENRYLEILGMLNIILKQIKTAYDEALNEAGKTDFDSIIQNTADLVNRTEFQSQKPLIRYMMIDEFQDTNALQFELISKACSEKTNLFVVGDSKQSIYAFQGAEIEVFHEAVSDRTKFDSVEPMVENYRSDGIVLSSVNEMFKVIFNLNKSYTKLVTNFCAEHQDLKVANSSRQDAGSFKFMITDVSDDEKTEYTQIAKLIRNIVDGASTDYRHITNLITEKKKAIAVLFDASTKMLELKRELNKFGVQCKLSASENFFRTHEVFALYSVIKSVKLLSWKHEKVISGELYNGNSSSFSKRDRFFLSAAYRSFAIRCSDNEVALHMSENTIPEAMKRFVDLYKTMTPSELTAEIIRTSHIREIYAEFDDYEQREANMNKFLALVIEHEQNCDNPMKELIELLDFAVNSTELKENEAFFTSDTVESIELCTIHSTKGLAYPMVILANSDKNLVGQPSRESIKINTMTTHEQNSKQTTHLIGFKCENYQPAAFSILAEIDKRKHIEEKKRLLYVALTRAEHDIVISGVIKHTKDGFSVSKDSYLGMITNGLGSDIAELHASGGDIIPAAPYMIRKKPVRAKVPFTMEPIAFPELANKSATSDSVMYKNAQEAVYRGSMVHKIIELHWQKFVTNDFDTILDSEGIFHTLDREKIGDSLSKLVSHRVYELLKSGAEHHFELPFNDGTQNGFIDLIVKDPQSGNWHIFDFKTGKESSDKVEKYDKQLSFYREFLESKGIAVAKTELIWL